MGFPESSISALMNVGLNRLEALAYMALLREPGITGYRVGKIIGKPAPNVYTALESLMKKGAVILNYVDRDKRFTPVPVSEFMQRMRSTIDQSAKLVERELKDFLHVTEETGIYKLENEDQLFEKIRNLITNSESTVLLTADTDFILRLKNDLSDAADRDIRVLILTFDAQLVIDGCEMLRLIPKNGENAWPGYWIVLDVDGISHVIAFFRTRDTLTHAIWCNDQCVSFWLHFGMLADFTLMTLFQTTDDGTCSLKDVRKTLGDIYCRYRCSSPQVRRYSSFLEGECESHPDGDDTEG